MKNILIIEDDRMLNKGVAFALKKDGYNTMCAYTKEEGKKLIQQNEVDFLITAEEHSRQIGEGAVYYGFDKKNIKHFDSKDDLMKQIEKLTFKGDYILFKASRGMAFEDVIDSLKRGGNL